MDDNKIVDVDYKAVREATNEELAAQANALYESMNRLGYMGLQMASEAGSMLKQVKNRLEHGQWEDWCNNNLNFGIRKANRMMQLNEKMIDENSFFSNPSTLTDLGISKVWALLSAPEEAAEEVAANPDASDMTTNEFKEELDRIKAENEKLASENQDIQKITEEINYLKTKKNIDKDMLEDRDKEIAELKTKLKKAKAEAKADAMREAEKKIEEAQEEATEESEQNKSLLENERQRADAAERELDKLKKMTDPAVQQFKTSADVLQESFNRCINIAESSSDPAKLKGALKKLISIMDNQL